MGEAKNRGTRKERILFAKRRDLAVTKLTLFNLSVTPEATDADKKTIEEAIVSLNYEISQLT